MIWNRNNIGFGRRLGRVLLPREAFLIRLREERLRSERSRSPVGMVTIEFSALVASLKNKNGAFPNLFVQHFAKAVEACTRETDIKGWCGDGKIAMLAPDTNQQGTRAIVDKLSTYLKESCSLNDDLGEEYFKRFFRASSLENDISALINGCNMAGKRETKGTNVQQIYSLKFSLPEPDRFDHLSSDRGTAVLVEQWPFSLELLGHIRGREFQLKVKRVIDIIGALTGIILFSPLMAVIAALIKITSPGPVLFRQERHGLLGRPFNFLKFRSMKTDCDPALHEAYVKKLIKGENSDVNQGRDDQPVYKITHDPRVTPIGGLLRKSSLDELPQLFNVLLGDMSLVGPRPPIPYECGEYKMWHYRRILEVKPGITGLWQVNGRSTTTFDQMVRLDLTYGRKWNLWLDIKILFKTPWVVLTGKGGY